MKKSYWPFLGASIFLMSCAGPPTLPKNPTTDTLTLSLATGSAAVTGTGAFYDYSQSTTISSGVTSIVSYSSVPITCPGGPFTSSDYSHDSLGFAITFTSGPITFSYQLDGSSGSGVANPSYTSGRFSF